MEGASLVLYSGVVRDFPLRNFYTHYMPHLPPQERISRVLRRVTINILLIFTHQYMENAWVPISDAWPWSCLNSRYTEITLNEEVTKFSADIFDASAKGYIGYVQYYFSERGADLYDNYNEDDVNPMYLAITNGHLRIVKYFVINDFGLSCGGMGNTNKNGLSPLRCAVFYGQMDIFKYSLKEINVYSSRDYEKDDSMFERLARTAARGGQLDMLKYFIDKKGFMVKPNDTSLLFAAAFGGNVDMLKYLLYEKNVRIKKPSLEDILPFDDLDDCGNLTIFCAAAMGGKLDAVRFLVETLNCTQFINDDEKYSRSSSHPLVAAVKSGSLSIVKYMLEEKGADFNTSRTFSSGRNLLHIAANYGHLAVVNYLVEQKHMDVDTTSYKGLTPLSLAILAGKLQVVKYLASERSASLNFPPGSNALIIASGKKDLKIVKFLVDDMKMISRIDEMDDMNRTAVMISVYHGELSILKFLVDDRHANTTIPHSKGKNLLHLAAEGKEWNKDYLALMRYLIEEKGFKVGARTAINETVLDIARKFSKYDEEKLNYLTRKLQQEMGDKVTDLGTTVKA